MLSYNAPRGCVRRRIGTAVNLASRLCDEALPGQILVSQSAFAEVEPLVEAESLAPLTLKGIHRPMPAFKVIGLKEPEAAPPAARTAS